MKAPVRGGKSNAAYLHGSFGSGKSHFITVLHAHPLVQALADADYDISDQELASALVSASAVLRCLEGVQWGVLDGVAAFAGRGDSVGARAERLVQDVTRAARADEFVQTLPPVLEAANERAAAANARRKPTQSWAQARRADTPRTRA
ncbi:hypothetical protein ACFQHO_50115 [Actinomadura yumaensis]|uniref:hypothetical protein n=1 Tax=Actinomadura yumaensis TaxID=111807 RepID=UPI003612D4E0